MNRSSFNKTTINAGLSGAVLRSAISAYPAAYITVTSRVFRRSELSVQPTASIANGSRIRARQQLFVIGKVGFRWANAEPGYSCRASITLTTHKLARGNLSLANQAAITLNSKVRRRATIVDQGLAQIMATPWVKSPTPVRSPSSTQGFVSITVTPHRWGTLPVKVEPTVQVVLVPKIRRRVLAAFEAVAWINANATEFRQIPYDLPAPPERTYQVTIPNRYVYVR